MESNKTQKEFYGMVTYVDVMGRGDGMKNFYDDRELYDADIAHQKSRNTGNYGTELTREQFIEEMANALEIQGHSFSIGSTLKGNYAEEIAVWKKNNPNAVSVHPELADLNRKAETVYNWEVANNVVDTTTSLDKHTGQIFIDDDKRFEERYLQIQDGQAVDVIDISENKKFEYRLLDRLKSDCEFFLGEGNGNEKYLWADNVSAQIDKMKELYNGFSQEEKPSWLSMDDILDYERRMGELKEELSNKAATVTVAIESTMDYTEEGFYRGLVNVDTHYDNNIYESRKAAQEFIEANSALTEINYDEMVREVGKQRIALLIDQQQQENTSKSAVSEKKVAETINNLEYDEDGYLYFTVEADGYTLEGLYRLHDPENGPDKDLVSIDYGYNHPIIAEQWNDIEAALQDITKERYEKLIQWKQTEKISEEFVKQAAETMKGIKESAERQKQAVAEQNSEAGAAEKKFSEYRGFAYTKNSKKPQIVYGNSKEDILNLLRKWNQTRTPGYTYDTCNIGKYNPETEKHENYRKIEVATGKDISNIYLKMPPNLSKTDFNNTIQYFKENGARYNVYSQKWYIAPELKDKFFKYLPENTEKMSEVQESPVEQAESLPTEPEKASALNYITGIDRQYVLDLKNGETLHVGEDEVLRRAGVSQEELSAGKIIEALEGKVQEHMQLFAQDSYDISVSSEFYDNRCTIWMHNGQSIDLYGDQYGVHFPTMEAKEISEIVSNYMKLQEKAPVSELKEGAEVTFYVPDYEVLPNGIKDIVGIKEVAGTLQEISADKYVVQEAMGNSTEVLRENIYDERQAVIMQKAVSKSFSAEQMDLVGQPRLSAAQMEQVFNGIQDKLSIYQVALYANPSIEAWQMDIYRYGMGNGIHFDDIKEIIQNNSMKPTSWEDSRNMVDKMVKAQRNLIIKDLKKNGLNPEKQLVRKFEKLNGMTGKMYSVEEVKKALKENSGNVPEDRKSVLKDIGKEINYQKNRALRPMAAAAQVPLR